MVFHSNILHCTFFTFELKNDENFSTRNHNYYRQRFVSITAPFADVFYS